MEGTNNEIIYSEGDTISAKDWFISKDEFEQVRIAKVEDGIYWVQKVDADDKYAELFDKLEAHARNKTLIQPHLNLQCLIQYEGLWYRVTIQDICNDSVKVFCTDFGICLEASESKFVSIDGFENVPSYCQQICFDENANIKPNQVQKGETILVKTIAAKSAGILTVEICLDEEEKELAASTAIALDLIRYLPRIISSLEISQCGFLQCHTQVENELTCTLICREFIDGFNYNDDPMLMKKFATNFMPEITKSPAYEPEIGEYLCGQQLNGDWYRGMIVSLNPNRLAAIDEARVFTPVSFAPLPLEYRDVLTFGSLAELKSTPNLELAGKILTFKVLEVFPPKGSAVVILATEDKSYEGEATLNKWIPKPIEQKGIEFAKLASGCEVQIVEVINQNEVYVHSKEPDEVVRRHHLELEIAKCNLNQRPLRHLPVVGQTVMALHKDVNYYRAHVVWAESKTDIQVEYVDYGNRVNVEFDQLFELPNELKKERSCAAKVKLKGVKGNIPLTEDAREYLAELIDHEVSLTCTFTGNPTIDGVVLKTPRDKIVNERLATFLKLTWENNEEEEFSNREIFTINQLTALKLGNVGDQIEATVICYYESPYPVVVLATYNDERVMRGVEDDVDERIQEYVKNTPNHYTPRKGELCIAMREGYYYRGVCLTPNEFLPDESRILFVDQLYNSIVKNKNIRMMTKEFLDLESLAIPCSISPMVPKEKLTAVVSQRLRELLVRGEQITLKIISEDNKTGMPYIDIPEMGKKLYD